MKLLITGGAGFIGSALIRHIITHTSHSVINFDSLSYAANLQSLAAVDNDDHYVFEHGDICDRDAVEQVFFRHQPDAILHLAGESHVDRSIKQPDLFITSNVVGTQVLLECARSYCQHTQSKAFRFLYVSSEEIYGSRAGNEQVDESAPFLPNSPYAGSKAAATHLVRTYFETYQLPTLITCSSNNYGPWQYPEKLIPLTINNALNNITIPLYDFGHAIRNWLYVDDHVHALLCVLEKGQPGQTYNINGNHEIENINLVTQICQQLDQLKPLNDESSYCKLIQFVNNRPGHDQRYGNDDSHIRNTLGWQPQQEFEKGLEKTVLWNLNHIKSAQKDW